MFTLKAQFLAPASQHRMGKFTYSSGITPVNHLFTLYQIFLLLNCVLNSKIVEHSFLCQNIVDIVEHVDCISSHIQKLRHTKHILYTAVTKRIQLLLCVAHPLIFPCFCIFV